MPAAQGPNANAEESRLIAEINDNFRRFLTGGQIVITQGVEALTKNQKIAVLRGVTNFTDFNPDNDPHHEHDFGSIEIEGSITIFWKIEYYDLTLTYHSPDATNPKVTRRILTIMLASEY